MRDAGALVWLLIAGVVPNLAYLALGAWILRRLAPSARGAERLALAFVFGSGIASLAILAVRAVDLPVPMPALAIVAASLPLALRGSAPRTSAGEGPGWRRAVDATSLAAALLLFLAALGPETWWDGFEYHLPMVTAWAEGPIRSLPAMIDAEFRAGVDLLYLPAVAAGAPDAAAAVTACFAAALAALVRAEATRRASPGAGAWAGLFALIVPFTVDAGPSTYTDLGVGAYGAVALLWADRWNRRGDPADLTTCALCLGFAVNAKLHAAILVPAVIALLLLGGRRPSPARLAPRAGLLALLVLPWFAKVALTTGNPLFPFFGGWLGFGPSSAALLAAKRGDVYHYVRVDRTPGGLLWYLGSLTFGHAYHIGGLLGPLPLALAPLALGGLARATRALVGTCLALFALQFLAMPALRFGAPLLPLLAIAAAVGGARLARSGAVARSVLAAALVTLAAVDLLAGAGGLPGAPRGALAALVPRVASLRDPQAYRRALFPDQVALAEVVAEGEPLVAIPRGAVAWMPRPVYNLHWSRNGELFFDGRTAPDAAWALLARRGVHSLVLDVEPSALGRGRTGHPLVDAWLRDGRARLRGDATPLPARRGRVWVLVDLSRPHEAPTP
jgi:hypothetical protein